MICTFTPVSHHLSSAVVSCILLLEKWTNANSLGCVGSLTWPLRVKGFQATYRFWSCPMLICLKLCYVVLCRAMLCYVAPCCLMLCCCAMLHYVVLCCLMLPYVLYVVLCCTILSYGVVCCPMLSMRFYVALWDSVVLCCAMLSYVVICFLLHYVALCCPMLSMLSYVARCCLMMCYVVLCCALLSYVVPCCLMSCYVALCCAMLSYVALCCLMLFYVALCCDMLPHVALRCASAKFHTGSYTYTILTEKVPLSYRRKKFQFWKSSVLIFIMFFLAEALSWYKDEEVRWLFKQIAIQCINHMRHILLIAFLLSWTPSLHVSTLTC